MPNLDWNTVQIIVFVCVVLTFLFRSLKVNLVTRQYKFSNSVRDPDEILRDLDSFSAPAKQAVEEQLKQFKSLTESKGVISTNSADKVSSISFFPGVKVKTRRVAVRASNPVGCLGIALICAVCGVAMAFALNYEQKIALESVSWIVTDGQITRSRNYTHSRSFETTPEIFYSYTVNGRIYFNDRIAFNDTWVQGHYDALKVFPVGKTVEVRYSPDDPSRSCLEVGNPTFLGHRLFLVILLFVFALFMLLLGLKSFRNKREENSSGVIQK